MTSVIEKVDKKIKKLGLSLAIAAKEIGVTAGSLEKHLSGEYIRSDSMAKYRTWISTDGREKSAPEDQRSSAEIGNISDTSDIKYTKTILFSGDKPTSRPFNIVDLFSGCGGMSLGFDLFENGAVY